jgi:hypothetical protein
MRPLVGDVRAVPVDQGWAVARVIRGDKVEFYSQPVTDVEVLTGDLSSALQDRALLFVLAVGYKSLKSDRWPRIGNVAAAEVPMVTKISNWKRDPISGKLSIYAEDLDVPGNWSERPATYDECIGLEQSAVWDDVHVEERLSSLFGEHPVDLPGTSVDPSWKAMNS